MTFYYAGLVSLLSLFEMNKLLIHDNEYWLSVHSIVPLVYR